MDAISTKRRCSKSWKHRGGTHTVQTQAERRQQITKLTQKEQGVVVRKVEAPWRDTHNADPGGKKEEMLTELTELTVTKTHPICGLW